MLLLLHGNNSVKSRQGLVEAVSQFKASGLSDIVRLKGPSLTLNELTVANESASMFGPSRLIVIENLFALKAKVQLTSVLKYLAAIDTASVNIIIWEAKVLTPNQLKALSNFQVRLYKTSAVTFKALEALKPGRQTVFLPLFDEAYRQDTPEFVFFMLVRHLRQLLTVSAASSLIPAWQRSKLLSVAKLFGETKLINLHNRLTDLDWYLKTGQTVSTLASELNYILSKNL
jgi:hypothetical protein